MKNQKLVIFLIFLLVALFAGGLFYWKNLRGAWPIITPPGKDITEVVENTNLQGSKRSANIPYLEIPDGYEIAIYAKDLGSPRDLEKDPKGTILVSIPARGQVVALPDNKIVVGNLRSPHGLAFAGGKLYIAETNAVAVYDYDPATKSATNRKKIIDLPGGGNHFTRSLIMAGSERSQELWISIGSSRNVCEEKDERRAAIWRADLDGSNFRPVAKGLRNSVFMTAGPGGVIWATDMGRDLLGDDIPPEEVNIIKPTNHYGWPYCWGDKVIDQETNKNGSKFDCSKSIAPHLTFQAHSAPLGLAFLATDLLVAYHGSWNRTVPTGYKVVRFPLDKQGNPEGEPVDFISGWLQTTCVITEALTDCDPEVLGRPVDIFVDGKNIYISDDKAGVVYLVKPIR